jgi:hypothetical protein
MTRIEGICRDVLEKSEWVAIATTGPDGPHVVGCWSHDMRALGVEGDELFIPAGRYHQTEENLKRDPRVELLFASRQVARAGGQGQGFSILGVGELRTSGDAAEAVKVKFPWARGVLIVRMKTIKAHL